MCTLTYFLTMSAALSVTAHYFFIAAKVRSVGDRVEKLITPMSVKALAARYISLAEKRGWPKWPVKWMWISLSLFVAFAIIDAARCATHR
jgi:hypothetical protein